MIASSSSQVTLWLDRRAAAHQRNVESGVLTCDIHWIDAPTEAREPGVLINLRRVLNLYRITTSGSLGWVQYEVCGCGRPGPSDLFRSCHCWDPSASPTLMPLIRAGAVGHVQLVAKLEKYSGIQVASQGRFCWCHLLQWDPAFFYGVAVVGMYRSSDLYLGR